MKNQKRRILLMLALLLIAVTATMLTRVRAADCDTPPIHPQSSATSFPQFTAVTVNIDPSFSAAQQAQIRQAFSNWSGSANNAGVSFQFTSNATPVAGTHTVQVSQAHFPVGANGFQPRGATSTNGNTVTGLNNATIRLDDRISDPGALLRTAAHEVGHIYGLADFPDDGQQRNSVMSDGTGFNDNTSGSEGPKRPCDEEASRIAGNYQYRDYPPHCPPPAAGCPQRYEWSEDTCRCEYTYTYSTERDACPIIIDVFGNGIELSSANEGVSFDFDSNRHIEKLAWTEAGSDDAWLVLDRNSNGRIDNGSELFSNYAPQPYAIEPYGFLALTEFDRLYNGGNNDGVINSADAIFSSVRLWQDLNHNGFSEPYELHTLTEFGIEAISLDYKKVKHTDEYGNKFIFRSKVYGVRHSDVGRWAWDVTLPRANSGPAPY